MIHALIQALGSWIDESALLGPLGVFRYVEFRALLAIILSFTIVIAFGERTIRWLVAQKIQDNPEFHNADLNEVMKHKRSTPTMGGILISGAILATTLLLADLTSFYVQMGLICLIWLFLLGLADDWLKLTTARRKPGTRDGLHSWEKLLFQIAIAVILGLFIHHHGANKFGGLADYDYAATMSHSLTLPFFKTWTWDGTTFVPAETLIVLGTIPFVAIAVLVIVGMSNAVNLSDGMDGLASGVMVIVAFAFMVLCLIAGFTLNDFVLAKYLLVPYIPLSDELAVLAGSMTGGCLGFLWFNCHPARVFMGDSGSLPLGGLIGFIAVVIRQEFLLLLIGGIFVLEALSVILQVGYYKLTGGKRIFRCAPIHHHFHLGGWTEQQTVIRFWLTTALLVAIALATIKIR
ncbi:phospho-N-acetylmuramoyl-pentapeptide-transferase [Mucisphaera sp.]|uniref:phospho-N-acetylmuramoyl-pentapeptide- transferase n=1 Tax=Mucisphaera sp. TaxID=2913024 RepID=UPI003D0AF121